MVSGIKKGHREMDSLCPIVSIYLPFLFIATFIHAEASH